MVLWLLVFPQIEHELERLVAASTKSLLRRAVERHEALQQQEGVPAAAGAGGGQFSSITKRFVKSVKDLSQELQGSQMQLHFIRCFIPNGQMQPDNFQRKVVLQQVLHSTDTDSGSRTGLRLSSPANRVQPGGPPWCWPP